MPSDSTTDTHATTQLQYPEDQYLFEIDPNPEVESASPVNYTERAKRAQAAKWKRLYALFHPRPVIDKAEVGPRCLVHGPILAYGWAFARADLMKYAEFHKISMPLLGYLGAKLGKPYVRYGALEGTDAQDEELLYFLGKCAWMAVRKHLEQEAGVKLLYLLPFSQAHDVMFAVYMNGEAERRIEEIDATVGLDDALDAIEFAISDAGVQSELLWWYDRAGLRTVDLNYPG